MPTFSSKLIKNFNVSYKSRAQQEDIFVHLLLSLPPNRDTLYVWKYFAGMNYSCIMSSPIPCPAPLQGCLLFAVISNIFS
jgi:hypothetical protein